MSDLFANLSVEDATLPPITRNRTVEKNPFETHVGESYRDGKGKSITVPGENASAAAQLIRRAAETLNIGVRIVATLKSNGERVDSKRLIEMRDKKSKANVVIQFQGQDKRKYSPKASATPATETAPVHSDTEPSGE